MTQWDEKNLKSSNAHHWQIISLPNAALYMHCSTHQSGLVQDFINVFVAFLSESALLKSFAEFTQELL